MTDIDPSSTAEHNSHPVRPIRVHLSPEVAESIRETARLSVANSIRIGEIIAPALVEYRRSINLALQAAIPTIIRAQEVSARIAESVAPVISGLSRLIETSIQPIIDALPLLVDLTTGLFPDNILEADVDFTQEWDNLQTFMMDEALPLAWVPRASTVEAIFAASSPAARRAVYGARWRGVLNDCEAKLETMTSSDMAGHVSFAQKAVRALRDGHSDAAQALAANTLDTILREVFSEERRREVLGRDRINPDDFAVRSYFIVCQLWGIHRPFYPAKNDPIPGTFNRHGAAHAVTRRQYSRLNAVLGVAHLTSLLCWLDQAYSRGR